MSFFFKIRNIYINIYVRIKIRREEIVNTNVTKRIPFQLKEKVKSLKVKKSSPKTKTQRKKNLLF